VADLTGPPLARPSRRERPTTPSVVFLSLDLSGASAPHLTRKESHVTSNLSAYAGRVDCDGRPGSRRNGGQPERRDRRVLLRRQLHV
jgi:hypothetical protein